MSSEYNFEEERQPFADFDYRDEMPTEEMMQDWREANDYVNEGDDAQTDVDDDRCIECNQTAAEGACFFCKMD